MKNGHYTTRQYKLAAGLILAVCAPAIAQVPPLNLPGLPPPPGVTNPAGGSSDATGVPPLMIPVPGKSAVAEPKKETNISKPSPSGMPNPTDMLPKEMLKEAGVLDEEPEDTAEADADTDGDPQTADSNDAADEKDGKTAGTDADDTKKTADTQTGPTTTTPALPLPTIAGTSNDAGPPPPPLPFGGLPTPVTTTPTTANTTANADMIGPNLPIDMDLTEGPEEKKDLKSWETTLAPSRTYPKTKFNYKRVVLPASIYRTQYSGQNRHLPKRLTRADLDKDFLKAVAKNDINATRALLNSGRNVNQMNAYGDSALIVAVRAGAYDTARLLIARGANTHFYGQGGKTAFHYARQQGNNDLAKLLIKG